MTAQLVRERIRASPLLQPMADAGQPALLGYDPEQLWLSTGGEEIVRYRWPGWWRLGLTSREDRAAEIANTMAREAAARWKLMR